MKKILAALLLVTTLVSNGGSNSKQISEEKIPKDEKTVSETEVIEATLVCISNNEIAECDLESTTDVFDNHVEGTIIDPPDCEICAALNKSKNNYKPNNAVKVKVQYIEKSDDKEEPAIMQLEKESDEHQIAEGYSIKGLPDCEICATIQSKKK